jgi:DNA-binding XRE family transcriptional regulator
MNNTIIVQSDTQKLTADSTRNLYQEILNALSKLATAQRQPTSEGHAPVEQLAQVIRAARIKQKLSQKELASLAGISVGTMVALENGKRTAGLNTVEHVLKALGLSLWIK